MAKPSSPSFRRILLSRLILLSVPVLLLGMCVTSTVTYRKARRALLDTARQNLTESAIRKAESMSQEIASLKKYLAATSQNNVLVEEQRDNYQEFVQLSIEQLPTQVQCLQLIEVQTRSLSASTCGSQKLFDPEENSWPTTNRQLLLDSAQVKLQVLLPSPSTTAYPAKPIGNLPPSSKLSLRLEVPVYNSTGNLSHILVLKTIIEQQSQIRPGSLTGYSVVIDESRTILMHPDPQRIGRNIAREVDASRYESLLKNAFSGRKDFLHFEFQGQAESVAGYTAISSPIAPDSNEQWAILAVTSLDDALAGLWEIQKTLVLLLLTLTLSLIGASFLVILYLSQDIARPLEKLRDFALDEDNLYSNDQVPQNLKIREFNELASALNRMVKRLKAWALELESAWKEAQTANQLKSEFLKTISHELRTPLNGIIGSIRLIADGFCDDREEEMEFLEQADRAAVRLSGIINDLLDISKIESGQLTVTLEIVDFTQLLAEAIAPYQPALEAKALILIPPETQASYKVHADPAKLKQVFSNIIDNAIKFTKTGKITVSVCVESLVSALNPRGEESHSIHSPVTHPTKQVVATIEDTGIGIAADKMDKLFRPFVMVDGSTTREAGGTGLGLALSRNFIELMGGTIVLTSSGKDKGTKVKIALPLIMNR
ncbi:sensor histidine kinase [Oscillatoria sp. FACHB-1406]|uniref:sensor histidine kinase n=1 Tax=Oscillatoria sp. FACHB-1406 TaxID=2692846 RepID=UPI00168236A2|nr:sensor histidine kinase [Oscillatoria sp. FACHB-1406]MBD2576613.1 sensor histidine kinase [Oscillatoria sp. FACHB-1406]